MSNQDYDELEGLADNNSSKKTYESKLVLMLTGCFEMANPNEQFQANKQHHAPL